MTVEGPSLLLPGGATLACAAVAAWLGHRLFRRLRIRALRGERGTAALEAALVTPVLLLLVLLTVQLALYVNAVVAVEHAAFCAGRSLAVWIGEDLPEEPANTIAAKTATGSRKLARAERAAALACTPIAPRTLLPGANSFRELVGRVTRAVGADGAEWTRLVAELPPRFAMSSLMTGVELVQPVAPARVPSGGLARLRVSHRFYLAVPVAGSILGRRSCWLPDGGLLRTGEFVTGARIPRRCVDITATAVVVNHGDREAD